MSERLFRRKGKDGKPCGAWYAWGFDANGNPWQRSTRQHDKRAAERVRIQWERAGGPPIEAPAPATLGAALDAIIADRTELATAGKRSEATAEGLKFHTKPWRSAWGDKFPLSGVTAKRVDEVVSARRAAGRSEHTIHKDLSALRSALRLAKRRGEWSGDIEAVLPVRFSAGYEPRTRALSGAELVALRAQLQPDRAAMVTFMVATGARLSEARRARREDLSDTGTLLRGTKTKRAFRIVPVVPFAVELMAFVRDHAKGEGGLLFTRWAHPTSTLHPACERAKIPRCSPNDLRRTFATWLRAGGVSPDLIAPAMGHVDSAMVEKVYGRLDPAALRALLTAALDRGAKGASSPTNGPNGTAPGNAAPDPEPPSERVSGREQGAVSGAVNVQGERVKGRVRGAGYRARGC